MARYHIEFKKSAKKELDSLPSLVQQRITEAVGLLSENPYPALLQPKKLRGTPSLYRFRIGEYRVVYEVVESRITIVIIKIGHRREVMVQQK